MYCNKSKTANLTSFDPETYIQQFTFCNHQPRAWDLRQSYIHCNHYGSLFCNFNLKEITAIIQTHNLTINFLAAVIIKKLKKSVRQRNNQVSGELHVCLWNVRSIPVCMRTSLELFSSLRVRRIHFKIVQWHQTDQTMEQFKLI